MKTAYSPLKVFHHQDRLNILRQGGQPAPAQAMIVLADRCNHGCSFCSYRWDGNTSNQLFHILNEDGSKNHNPDRYIPTDKAKEILDDCAEMGIGAVQFTGGGEPTVHPDHREIIEYAMSLGLDVSLVTNGTIVRAGMIELMARMQWVRVSIDAARPETYERIRSVQRWQMVRALNHIEQLVAKKKRTGSKVEIGIGFVVTAENWSEVVEAAQIAKRIGVDNFRISAVFQPENAVYFAAFYHQAAELCREAQQFTSDEFQVFNLFGDRIGDLEQASPDYSFCGVQHFATYIGGDLQVYRCCNTAYNERGLIGSIKEQSFRQLWESQAKRDDFAKFDASGCERCQFNSKNRTILYAIDPEPAHVNFV